VSEQEFEALFSESLLRFDAYIATQVTEEQILSAQHKKKTVEMNKGHFKWMIDKGDTVISCRSCGALSTTSYVKPICDELAEHQLCYHCNHWRKVADTQDKTRLIIDGHIYGDGGNRPNETCRHLLGFGGHVWTIERDGRVWQTNNLWSGSTVPQEHRGALKDNARFVKAGEQ
jgi:hypothetical protein